MYSNTYIPRSTTVYRSQVYPGQGDRFFLAPFLVGGLAGTALGYGIANNNQQNNNCCCGGCMYPYPVPIIPYNNQFPSQVNTASNSFSNYGNTAFY